MSNQLIVQRPLHEVLVDMIEEQARDATTVSHAIPQMNAAHAIGTLCEALQRSEIPTGAGHLIANRLEQLGDHYDGLAFATDIAETAKLVRPTTVHRI